MPTKNSLCTDEPSSSENRNICIECGLCCDGSIYPNVFIYEDEDTSFLQQFGFKPVKVNGELSSPLPCKWQKENLCMLYSDPRRLKSCKDYKCKLMERYILGEISYIEAMEVINALLRMKTRIKGFFGLLSNTEDKSEILLSSFIDEVILGEKMDDFSFKKGYSEQIKDCFLFVSMVREKMSCEAFEKHTNSFQTQSQEYH